MPRVSQQHLLYYVKRFFFDLMNTLVDKLVITQLPAGKTFFFFVPVGSGVSRMVQTLSVLVTICLYIINLKDLNIECVAPGQRQTTVILNHPSLFLPRSLLVLYIVSVAVT